MTSTSYRLTIAIFNLQVTCVTVSVLKNKILNYCGRREFQIHRGISHADLARLKCQLSRCQTFIYAMSKRQPQQDVKEATLEISKFLWYLFKSLYSNHYICVRMQPTTHKPKVTVFLSIPRYYTLVLYCADLQA